MTTKSEKSINYAIFYVIKHHSKENKFLTVKRPHDDKDLPNMWGIPAGSVKENESFEEAAIRQAKNKLGVNIKILGFIGRGNIDRGEYILHGEEFLVEIVNGELNVNQLDVKGTRYQDWKWGALEDIREAAEKGYLCSNIYIKKKKGNCPLEYSE